MTKRIGRTPVEVNISSPQNNHIPIFDEITRLWNTLPTSSLFAELLSGSNSFSGSQTIEGDLIVSGSIFAYNVSASSFTGSLFGTASLARNSISASYLSGSQGIVNTFTSSGDIAIRNIKISTGTTPGLDNLVIGSGSLIASSSNLLIAGDNNIAIGNKVLSNSTIGYSNTAVGFAALQKATSSYNTAVGAYALWSTVSGRNTAVGQGSLPYLVSGSGNTAVGDATMFFLVSGNNNTAIGNVAMQRMTYGSGNTSLGSGVLFSTFLSGSNNTVLGFLSALGIVTGSANTIIGANVTGLPTTLNNNIILADGEGNIRARYSSSMWNLSGSVLGSFTGSLLGTASWAENSVTASYAPAYLPLTGGTINGDVVVNGTASISFLNVIYESASVIYSSGSNQFGDAPDDIQTLYGSVVIPTGSLSITGSISSTEGISGSLYGTASWALTASYATNVPETASYALQAISSSYPIAVSGSTIHSPLAIPSNFSTNNSLFLGFGAGYSSNNANYSNFLGYQAGAFANNSVYSNFIGQNAGYEATNASASNFIGKSAGYKAYNSSYSILIGTNAGANEYDYFTDTWGEGIGSNNIIIGNSITLDANRKDSINIGGLIFATGSYFQIDGSIFSGSANGRIGINQPFPLFSLDVSGSGRYENGLTVTGSLVAPNITGSLQGTASWALNALTASYASNVPDTASFAIQAISSSYPIAVTGSTIYSFGTSLLPTNNSIFLGANSGYNAIGSNNSQFIGQQSGQEASESDISSFIGFQSGYQAKLSRASVFMGYASGRYASTSSFCVYIGIAAGENSKAADSVFIGNYAGSRSNLDVFRTGSVFIGNRVGYDSGADYSVFIGEYTGLDARVANYSNFIGYYSGYLASSASYSTLIGYRAGYNSGQFLNQSIKSNNIIIGTNITLPGGTQDSINIGGLIFATGSYSTVTGVPFSGSANGYVGINQPLPTYSLDVSGSGRYTNGLIITGSLIAPNITGSLFGTASWALNAVNALTASYVEAGAVQNLVTYQISTGSIVAKVNTTIESLFLINSGSSTYFNISSSGNTELYSDLFIVKSFTTNQPVFTVSQSVVKFATQSLDPVGTAEAGALWFTSTNMYVALD